MVSAENKGFIDHQEKDGVMNDKADVASLPGGEPANGVLIIDDDSAFCRTLGKMIQRMGLTATCRTTLQEGLTQAESGTYDVIFLDVNFPTGSGLDIIDRLRSVPLPPEIIVITGYGSENGAETAMRHKAWDYIQKDATFQNIKLSLRRALLYRNQKRKKSRLLFNRDRIVGHSPVIAHCLEQAANAADSSDAPVLISGETGTGKEVFARAIHENSVRSNHDFVVVDCTTLPENLVESILFGHCKGAFTNAQEDAQGLVRQADKGTLFLDEVGELPLDIQKKFLRVLQEKSLRPVGGHREVRSDFRVICATHRNLSELVAAEQFRQDLYFRIKSFSIQLPTLRQRKQDINALVMHYLAHHCRLAGDYSHGISPEFLEVIQLYDWPGNVRELFSALDWAHSQAIEETVLFPRHLPLHIRTQAARTGFRKKDAAPPPAAADPPPNSLPPLKTYLETMRCQYVRDLMEISHNNVQDACRLAHISRGHLYELLKKCNLR